MTLRGLIHRGIFQFSATSVIFYNILPCGIMAIFDKTETFQQYCFGLRPDRGGVPRGPRGRSSPARWVGAGLRRRVKKKKKSQTNNIVSSSSTRDATLFTKTGEYEYIFRTIHIRNNQVQHEQPCQ